MPPADSSADAEAASTDNIEHLSRGGDSVRAWGRTDIGKVRSENQDTYFIELDPAGDTVCVVCDGMGGAKAGATASLIAASAFVEEIRSRAPGVERSAEFLKKLCRDAVETANREVYEKASSDPEFNGMGTTLVAAVGSGDNMVIVNIGDSRAYLITDAGIERLTRDHSLVEDMMIQGDLTREQARSHPSKNLITRAIGADASAECDVYFRKMRPGEHLLLCSDGLTNMVEEQEILYEVLHGGDKSLACSRLVDIANDRGGRDNITVVLLEI